MTKKRTDKRYRKDILRNFLMQKDLNLAAGVILEAVLHLCLNNVKNILCTSLFVRLFRGEMFCPLSPLPQSFRFMSSAYYIQRLFQDAANVL